MAGDPADRGPLGCHHISLSVTDLARSSSWYLEVLGLAVVAEVEGGGFRRLRMRRPDGGLTVTLTRHDQAVDEPFDERRAGLDHVAFDVGGKDAVLAVERRLTELGIEHAEPRAWDLGASLFVRDPDNIQVEVFGADG